MQIETLFYSPFRGKQIQIPCESSKCFKMYGDGWLKCFTYDIKFNKENNYKVITFVIKKTKQLMNVRNMKVFLHHPGQLFRNGRDPVLSGPYHKIASSIRLSIQSLSVITNREHRKLVCNSRRFDDDKILMEKSRQGLNCSSKYPGMVKQIIIFI